MSEIHEIANCARLDRILDVIFVHGADGDWQQTWRVANAPDKFWPAWLGEDALQAGIWSLDYEASTLAWKGTTMPLADRAVNVLDRMEMRSIGQRPILFVCHSLGGLLVKQMLRSANDYSAPEIKRIADQTRGIVFLSTPHAGAALATNVNALNRLLFGMLRPTATLEELAANHSRLRDLNVWYRNYAPEKIKTFVYYENQLTNGTRVVDAGTADPGIGGVIPVPMDDDHISICKLKDRGSQIYQRVRRLIAEISTVSTSPANRVERRSVPPAQEVSSTQDTRSTSVTAQNTGIPSTFWDQLYDVLAGDKFDLEDMRDIAFRLTIPWDDLRGDHKPAKARALIERCAKDGRLSELRAVLQHLRPGLDLPNPP